MGSQTSIVKNDSIEYGFWLVFDSVGGMRFARLKPGTDRNERAIKCTATLPLSLFRTAELRATITVAAPVTGPIQIDVAAASEALKAALGVDIDIKVVS